MKSDDPLSNEEWNSAYKVASLCDLLYKLKIVRRGDNFDWQMYKRFVRKWHGRSS